MMRSETAKRENDEKRSSEKRKNSLFFWMEFFVVLALGTGIGLLLRYVWGWDPLEKLLTEFGEILIYAVIGIALLIIYITRKTRRKD